MTNWQCSPMSGAPWNVGVTFRAWHNSAHSHRAALALDRCVACVQATQNWDQSTMPRDNTARRAAHHLAAPHNVPKVRAHEIPRPTDQPWAWSRCAPHALPKGQNAKVLRNLAAKMHRIPTRARRISTKRAQRGISHAIASLVPDVDDFFQLSHAPSSPCDRCASCLSFFP